MKNSIVIKSNKYGLVVILDEKLPFEELVQAIGEKFAEAANFFKDAKMAVTFQGRILNANQEKQLVAAIVDHSQIHILCVVDERKEEEAYYQKAVNTAMEELDRKDGQFYKGTLRAGQVLEMESSVVIIGDVNPGATVISKGNIVVLGSLRGTAYAGASGNRDSFVSALVMKPIQVRIADKIARSAITKRVDTGEYVMEPKVAYIKEDHIYVKDISQESLNEIAF